VLNGIVWQAMRPASDEYDVQKMQGATAAIEALRRAGGPGPSSDAGTARAQDTLEFATAMIMLIKPVDDYPIAEQCRQIQKARTMAAGLRGETSECCWRCRLGPRSSTRT
jgi:hypothetical protein